MAVKISSLNIVANENRAAGSGQKRFSARVQTLYVVDESGKRLVRHQFGDAWGRTRNEAIQKIQKAVDLWVAAQADPNADRPAM